MVVDRHVVEDLAQATQGDAHAVGPAHAAELAAAKVSVAELRAATAKIANRLASQADRVFTHWLHEIAEPAIQS